MSAMQQRIEQVAADQTQPLLTRRVYELELAVKELRAMRPPEVPVAPPVSPVVEEKPEPEVFVPEPVTSEPEAPQVFSSPPPPLPEVEPEPVPMASFSMATAQPAGPTLSQRVRESMQGEEWEAVVGSSWLNKLGVLVLVIGIALFLGYSFTQVGPGGRAAIGLGVSVAMLAGGFLIEKKPRYKIFARGLLGGGWAALYFTTYAMQAVDAAKVIDNPFLGGVLLLAVAAGMIVHSLRYQSQTVTGLAYFVAFATLSPAVTPASVTAVSVIALAPLAASLLFVAYRFQWSEMALLGLIATYGACASRGDSGAPLWSVQLLFCTYWLLFEGFDLLRAARRSAYSAWESAILPFNALAFIGLSYMKWSVAAPQHLHALAAGIGTAYLVSTDFAGTAPAAVEFHARDEDAGAGPVGRLRRADLAGGSVDGSRAVPQISWRACAFRFAGRSGSLVPGRAVLQASLSPATRRGIVCRRTWQDADRRSPGRRDHEGWQLECEGVDSGGRFERASVLRESRAAQRGHVLWLRGLGRGRPHSRFRNARTLCRAELVYPGRAAFCFWMVATVERFPRAGLSGGTLGLGGIAIHLADVAIGAAPPLRHPWIALSCAAVISYLGALCGLRSAADRLEEWERSGLRRVGSWASTAALVALAWRALPGDYLGLGWLALALLILELGLRGIPEDLRVQAYVVAGLGALRVFFFNFLPITNSDPLAKRWIMAGAALLAYLIAARTHVARKQMASATESNNFFNLSSATGTLFLMAGLWALLPAVVIGPAWAVVALLLMEAGFVFDLPGLRLQAHAAGGAAFGRLFFANFTGLGRVGMVSHRVLTVLPVLVSYYYQWSRQSTERSRLRKWELPLGRLYLYAAAVLVVVLMRFELGRVATVTGWAAFALGLLVFGLRWKNVDLRWQSYILAALAFWRSWTTNFYAPESFAGVSGRILTGAFVIACFYAAQLLIPRKRRGDRA